MGKIISQNISKNGKSIFEIELEKEESLQLEGCMDNICLFSEDVGKELSHVSSRGKDDATQYFLIPKEFRKYLVQNAKALCQRFDSPTKSVFVFVVNKDNSLD